MLSESSLWHWMYVLALVLPVQAALYRRLYRNPEYPDKCFVNEYLILNATEVAPHPDFCGRIRCLANSTAEVATCGVIMKPTIFTCPRPNSTIIEAAYPDCCADPCNTNATIPL